MRHEKFPVTSQPAGGNSEREFDERGASARTRITLICEVRQGTRPWKLARLIDLSTTGFRLAWLPEYDQVKPIRIRIPAIEMLTARVCWHEGREIGCQFATPLHVAVFEHIARLAGGDPAG